MSATALELHEVLEEEFVRTGGEELPGITTVEQFVTTSR